MLRPGRGFVKLCCGVVILCSWMSLVCCSVWYDHRAIVINGQRKILISGSIHYPRSTPEMWPGLIQKAKDGGLDVIQTYVFWNGHEPSPDQYYFEDRFDLVRFVKLVKQAGLYLHLRLGPYVCAEWNFGGLPVWLKYVPGISFRTDNGPFKAAMEKFTRKIVGMMKEEALFESQGGPIIMSQIENEYGPVEWEIGAPGRAYTNWAAEMALGLGTGVPWVMCKQDDAPDPIINTCNGFYCDYFTPNRNYKPKMWTEAWTGWFTAYGGAVPKRPAEDLAFSVARFIATGGSFVNYYMYHGGTNFGRTAGGPFYATSYDYDAPIDEYGMPRQPKWGHLKELHRAIKMCEPALIVSDPVKTQLGPGQEAYVYKSNSGACAAFLTNLDWYKYKTVKFEGVNHHLPPWSVSILPDCKYTVLNTARVNSQSSQITMTPWSWNFPWEFYNEETASDDDNTFSFSKLLEQISVTRDDTDYLWYMTEVKIDPKEAFLDNGKYPSLSVQSAGHVLYVFINGQLSGIAYGGLDNNKLTFTGNVKLWAGSNKISLLSAAVGLPNVGVHFETWNAGVLGPVVLYGLDERERDLTNQEWSYKVGLKGEALKLHSLSGSSSVEWTNDFQKQPMTWYKTFFHAPEGDDPLALDMHTMGKGQAWINGQSIGRYWPAYKAQGECKQCYYGGTFDEKKCQTNCGEPSQRWYHVPRSWLKPTGNLLILFEEMGGNPSGISLVKRRVQSICADIYEQQPTLKNWRLKAYGMPKASLSCEAGQKISSVKFASYGTPNGVCGSYQEGSCHAHKSWDPFTNKCIGQQTCSVPVVSEMFGGDPCWGVMKKLSVELICN